MSFPTTSVLDDFNRADSSTLGANYAADPYNFGHSSCQILSNQVAKNVTDGSNYWSAATFGPDSESYIDLPTLPTVETVLGVRLLSPATTGVDGYLLLESIGSPDGWSIFRVDNGGLTQLGATVSQDISAGDSIGLEVIGSTLKGYRKNAGTWAEIISRTDSTYTSAGNISSTYCVDASIRADNFGGGTVVVASVTATSTIMMMTGVGM